MSPEKRLGVVGDYKHGSICRVKLYNFLTYADVEVVPGPRLNMVIGPNGTGKSTILCAICLGLGGEPRLLGRATDVETFVANGQDEGEIELEIVNTEGTNPIIRRQIRRGGSPKSVFFWNDNHITGKAVRETCLQKYQISVDNLCTFLPQDRVGSFSGFDSKQLLIETEKSLSASQNLYHTHQELIKDQEEMQGGDNRRETLEDKLDHLKHEHQRLQRAKALMQERDEAMAQADLLRKKIIWLRFDDLIVETNAKKTAKAGLKQNLREIRSSMEPLEDEASATKKRVDEWKGQCKSYEMEIRQHQKEMEKQSKKYEAHDDQIENTIQELNTMDSQRAIKETKVQELKEKVEQYMELLNDCPSMESLKEEELQCRNDIKASNPQFDNAKREHSNLVHDSREVEDEFRRAQTKMLKLQDEKARRKERIFRQQPQLLKIDQWLHSNRTQFRKSVVGPIMCEITTNSESEASYLEQHVPNSTLKAFVVQCKEDYDFLYKSVRQDLKLPINIILIRESRPSKRMYSDQKMALLKRDHGVLGYMDETFTAPELVIEALKASASVEKVLVGTEKTQESLDNKNLLNFLSEPEDGSGKLQGCCIFSCQRGKTFKYTSMVSRYSGKSSVRVDDVRAAKFLAPGVSDNLKQKAKEELDAIQDRRNTIKPAIDEAEAKLRETQKEAQDAKEKLKGARATMLNVQKVITKKRNAEVKLRDAESELAVNDEKEKEQMVSQLNKRICASLKALEAHSKSYKQMMKSTVKSSGARLSERVADTEERRARQLFTDATEACRSAEVQFKTASEEFAQAKKEVHELKRIADREAAMQDEDGKELPLKAQLEELPFETLDEAELALEEANNKAESIVADQSAVREYERNNAEMEEVQAQLDDVANSDERRRVELDQKVKPWKTSLVNSVHKIDILFSKYMAEMGCTGEVVLAEGEGTTESPYGTFKDWGIEIRVAFREGHKTQVLSARVQSGGERSVSTIMYLMALQEMMVSPFRCVDEINQGLDERNERLVFKRIVSNSTRPPVENDPTNHSGQYFLITPKLLPNLYDMEVEAMTVLFIFNGPYNVKNPKDWDVFKLLSLRKRSIVETEAAGDAENTQNSQPEETRHAKHRKLRVKPNNTDSAVEDLDI